MRSRLAIWALLLLLAAPASAGVVEDAAEALKNVPSDRLAGSRRFEEAANPLHPSGAPSWNSPVGAAGAAVPTATRNARPRGGAATASASAGGAVAHPTPEVGQEAPGRPRTARDRFDGLATMFALLAILLLVAVAGFYSRRLGRDD